MIEIPRDRLTIRFARSGGPGGQNVNKVETKAEIRFVVAEADWIPEPARRRLGMLQRNRITRGGELVIASERFRSQSRNIEDCLDRLHGMLEAARHAPKKRIPTKATRGSQRRRLESKTKRSATKKGRRWRPNGE